MSHTTRWWVGHLFTYVKEVTLKLLNHGRVYITRFFPMDRVIMESQCTEYRIKQDLFKFTPPSFLLHSSNLYLSIRRTSLFMKLQHSVNFWNLIEKIWIEEWKRDSHTCCWIKGQLEPFGIHPSEYSSHVFNTCVLLSPNFLFCFLWERQIYVFYCNLTGVVQFGQSVCCQWDVQRGFKHVSSHRQKQNVQ